MKDLEDLTPELLTHEELQLLDLWVWSRAEVVRDAKARHPDNQEQVFRALGWPTRRERGG